MKSRKLLPVISACFVLFTLVSSSSVAQTNTDIKGKEYTAAVPKNFPPHYQLDAQGNPTGFAIDVMDALAKRGGFTVRYQVMDSWKSVAAALKKQEVNFIPNLGISAARKEYASFSSAVEVFPIVLITRRDSTKINSLPDVDATKIGAVEFNVGVNILKAQGVDAPRILASIEEALFALLAGNLDAIAYPEAVALMTARKAGIENQIRIVRPALKEIKRAIAVARDQEDLLPNFNRLIAELTGSSELAKIYVKWYGVKQPFWTLEIAATLMIAITVFMVLGFLFWRHYALGTIVKKLRESEFRLKTLVDDRQDAILVHQNGKFVFVNHAAVQMLGGETPDEFVGASMLDYIDPEFHAYAAERTSEAMTDGKMDWLGHLRMIDMRGQSFPVETATNRIPWSGDVAIQVVVRDLTDAERTNAVVQEHERNFRATFEQAAVGIAHISKDGGFMLVNDRFCQITGRDRSQLYKMGFADITHPDDLHQDQEAMEKMLSGKLLSYRVEKRYLSSDGKIIWVNLSVAPVKSTTNSSDYFVSVVEDITDKKQVEERERRLLDIIEATPDIIAITDPNGNLLFLNISGRLRLGMNLDAPLTGLNIKKFIAADDYKKIMRQGIPKAAKKGSWYNDTTFVLPDGSEMPTSQIVLSHRGPTGDIDFYSTISRDISDYRDIERKLIFSQKMEAIGQLTGGVAHDFNNLLQVLQSNIELVKILESDDHQIDELLNQALEGCERGSKLTRQLLAFSRKQKVNPESVDLGSRIDGMLSILERTLGEHIEIKPQISSDLPRVRLDPHIFENTLLNLVLNAKDAMPEGGVLCIGAEKSEIKFQRDKPRSDIAPGRYVHISVTDAGEGMEQEILEHIFEPFFTTKDVGEGSGLGLSMVYGFVEQSGGQIKVESELGKGTQVGLWFPVEDVVSSVTEEENGSDPAADGDGKILLVEDDPDVRQIARLTLIQLGYQVLEASDAKSALRLIRKERDIDLLFSDVVMPGGMSGFQLAKRVLANNPEIRVLLTSGYPDSELKDVSGSNFNLIRKPYSTKDLGRTIEDILAAE